MKVDVTAGDRAGSLVGVAWVAGGGGTYTHTTYIEVRLHVSVCTFRAKQQQKKGLEGGTDGKANRADMRMDGRIVDAKGRWELRKWFKG